MSICCILLLALTSSAPPDPLGGPSGSLVGWLMQTGRGGPAADAERLDRVLRTGEVLYLDGADHCAAARLGALLLDPAFAKLAGTPGHDNARYLLAGALLRQGAVGGARRLLLELLSRDPASDFRAPAFRKLIDLTVHFEQFEESLRAIEALAGERSLDERDEIAYLKGKALLALGHDTAAVQALESITRSSRFYGPALYLSAVLELRIGQPAAATAALCRLVAQPAGGGVPFFLSDAATRAIEYAWLALGRLRNQAGYPGWALEAYSRIPFDSELGPVARYEASWSLFRLGRRDECRAQLQGLLGQAVSLPDRPAAELLLGYALLGDCMFDEAEEIFSKLERNLGTLSTVLRGASEILPAAAEEGTPPTAVERRVQALAEALRQDLERLDRLRGALAQMVSGLARREPPRPLAGLIDQLGADESRTRSLRSRLLAVRQKLGDTPGEKTGLLELQAIEQIANSVAQRAATARTRLLRAQALAPAPAPAVPDPNSPLPYAQVEEPNLLALAESLLATGTRAADWAARADRIRVRRASVAVAALHRQASLGRVDSAIGRKQALELEVQNLALGRFPLSLLRELAEAGQLDESLEYWPYDGEGWPDEVE